MSSDQLSKANLFAALNRLSDSPRENGVMAGLCIFCKATIAHAFDMRDSSTPQSYGFRLREYLVRFRDPLSLTRITDESQLLSAVIGYGRKADAFLAFRVSNLFVSANARHRA
jgi:hypothetical protein